MLNLERKYTGYYQKEANGIMVTVSKMVKGWEFIVEENNEELAHEFFNTKKEACEFGTQWITNNI